RMCVCSSAVAIGFCEEGPLSSFRTNGRFSLLQIVAGLLVAALVPLSLVPGFADIRTSMPGEVEHFIAYLLVGAALTLLQRRKPVLVWAALCLLAATLEGLQIIAPGRSPTVVDAMAGCLGSGCGVVIAHLALRSRRRRAIYFLQKGPSS